MKAKKIMAALVASSIILGGITSRVYGQIERPQILSTQIGTERENIDTKVQEVFNKLVELVDKAYKEIIEDETKKDLPNIQEIMIKVEEARIIVSDGINAERVEEYRKYYTELSKMYDEAIKATAPKQKEKKAKSQALLELEAAYKEGKELLEKYPNDFKNAQYLKHALHMAHYYVGENRLELSDDLLKIYVNNIKEEISRLNSKTDSYSLKEEMKDFDLKINPVKPEIKINPVKPEIKINEKRENIFINSVRPEIGILSARKEILINSVRPEMKINSAKPELKIETK